MLLDSALIIYFIFSFLISWFLLYIFIPIFKKKWIVLPNKRSSHNKPTPIGGGLIFSFIYLSSSLFYLNFDTLFAVPILLVGHLDDCKGIKALKRLIIQVIIGVLLFFYKSDYPLLIFLNFQNLNFLIRLISIFTLVFFCLNTGAVIDIFSSNEFSPDI